MSDEAKTCERCGSTKQPLAVDPETGRFHCIGWCKCNGCHEELEICPHCTGGDDIEGGHGQGGFYICTDEDCPEYEVCCGC